jgi:hypothetical protein
MARNRIHTAFAVLGTLVIAAIALLAINRIPGCHKAELVLESDSTEIERLQRLQADQDRLRQQISRSNFIATRLINGEISLLAAIEEMDLVNQDRVVFVFGVGQDATRKEHVAYYAVWKAAVLLEHDPIQKRKVLVRLRAEFLSIFGHPIQELDAYVFIHTYTAVC